MQSAEHHIAPNPRLQRARLRAPLSRQPLGDAITNRGTRLIAKRENENHSCGR